MVEKVFSNVSEFVDDHEGLARTVLHYSLLIKRIVDEAKQPGFTVANWAPLAELVAIDEFERVGNFLEVMNWHDYVEFLTRWATTSHWECSFKRITQQDNVVFLELEERSGTGEAMSAVNSATIYEFNAAGKLRHLDIYLQMKLPEAAMPQFYQD